MSRYNKRINAQLMNCCLALSKDVLERQINAFFPNIMSYWNHLLFGDLILLGRLASNEIGQLKPKDFSKLPSPKSPQDIYHTHLPDLASLRLQVDELIDDYC